MSLQMNKSSNFNSMFDTKFRALFLGKNGTGKTTLAIKFLERVNLAVLFYDIKSDVQSNVFTYMDEKDLVALDDITLKRFVATHIKKKLKLCIRGSVLTSIENSQRNMARLITTYLSYLEGVKRKSKSVKVKTRLIFAVDELDLFAPKGKSESNREFGIMFSKGRSIGCVGWGMSQRAQMIHNNVISQTEQLYLYFVNKKDLDILEDYFENSKTLKFDYKNDPHRFYRSYKNEWGQATRLSLGGKKNGIKSR